MFAEVINWESFYCLNDASHFLKKVFLGLCALPKTTQQDSTRVRIRI